MKDDLFNFDESLAGGFDTPTNDYEAQLKKARTLCIRGRYEQALAICESILDEDMDVVGAYIEILRVHSEDFTIFEGKEIEQDIHAIERLFPDVDNDEYIDYLQKRNKFLKAKGNTSSNASNVSAQAVENVSSQTVATDNKKNKVSAKDENSTSKKKNSGSAPQKNTRGSSTTSMGMVQAREIIENQSDHPISKVAEAKKAMDALANNGDANALFWLGRFYDTGRYGYPEDKQKAFDCFQKAAGLGSDIALYNLGIYYQFGNFVRKNMEKAFEYYKQAADLGFALAMHDVGCCYRDGQGVAKDIKKALTYFQKAADAGNNDAKNALKELQVSSMGSDEDQEIIENPSNYSQAKVAEAKKAFEALAESGNLNAFFYLATYYHNGEFGYPQNLEKAFKLYERAAEQNDEYALYNLGFFYQYGEVVPENPTKAFECYKKAADLGLDVAMYDTGFCYHYGYGVRQNLDKAIEYYIMAAKLDNEDAKYALEQLGVDY